MRVIVTGSRHWKERTAIHNAIASLNLPPNAIIVHGDAKGADKLADKAAKSLGFKTEPHPADWEKYYKAAGPIRNREMLAAGADLVLAFPIGDKKQSPGTWNMIEIAQAAGVEVKVFEGHDGEKE